ncbi:MAG: type 4a pilus biogenesis protein PilO [Bacillota bacterium]|nr:type 4a pilus biogenesis protein PilO [Bacillota bacterium]
MAADLKYSRKEVIIIALIGLLIIAGLVLIFLQARSLGKLREAVREEEIALDEAQTMLARRMQYRDNAEQYKWELQTMERLIPAEPEEEKLLRYFDRLAEEYDMDVQSIRFDARTSGEEENYVSMPMTIVLEGRYRDLVMFLNHLYNGERAVRVDDLRIALASSPEQPAGIKITMAAEAFHLKSE